MLAEVDVRLRGIEATEHVKVLYACESGSRGWGFASADSDYDVRFIYVHRQDWYLSIDLKQRRDVIEQPLEGVWDVNGWDLQKALQLFLKSNPPLLEWLSSPIVYREVSPAIQRLREIAPDYYSPKSCYYHYWTMAEGQYRRYFTGEAVILKRYFYVLRPLLALRWIEMKLGVVPMEFEKLVQGTIDDQALRSDIQGLIETKQVAQESGLGSRVPSVRNFIEEELRRVESRQPETELQEVLRPH